jgi:hypothetical protein
MVFNKRHEPLLQWANLLAIANIICCGMPVFNAMAFMPMVDRWRLETHSFHLLCDKMTVTLEEVAMILGCRSEDVSSPAVLSHPRGARELLGSLVASHR